MTLNYLSIETGVGHLWVGYRDGRVCFSMLTPDEEHFLTACQRRVGERPVAEDNPEVGANLQARLAGDAAMDFDLDGCTSFQRDVLATVAAIPKGEVRTYAQVAAAVGRPRAARAVGEVMRTNPIPVLIPCHRVIRSTGAPGNYSPRPEIKRQLLILERAQIPSPSGRGFG